MDIEVKLRPHIGQVNAEVGGKTVTVDQDMGQCFVMANGKTVGIYCGKQSEPNKYLSFTEPLHESIQKDIAGKVAELTGGVSKFNAPPPDEHELPTGDEE